MKHGWMVLAALSVGILGCGDSDEAGAREVSIEFAGNVGDEDFVCGTTYNNLGSANTPLQLVDFRLYVQGIELRNSAGDWVAVALTENNFQTSGAVLLDFEDGCGEFGDGPTNDTVSGTVPEGTYDAIRFQMGVPFEVNHNSPATAPPPLNRSTMQWDWQGGYKFLRVDSGSFMGGGWRMHLGSAACDGDSVAGGTTGCDSPNRVDVELDGFDPDTNTVVADARALVAGQDLENLAPMPPGCMSGPSDPDCTSIFGNLGLPFGGNPAPGSQSFFTAR